MKLKNNNTLETVYGYSVNREDFIVKARSQKHSLQSIANFLQKEEGSKKALSRQRIKQIEDDTRSRIAAGEDITIRPSYKKSDHYDDYFMRKIKLTEKMKKVILFIHANEKEVVMKTPEVKVFFQTEKITQHVIDGLVNRELVNLKKNTAKLTKSGERALNCVLKGITGKKVNENQNKE